MTPAYSLTFGLVGLGQWLGFTVRDYVRVSVRDRVGVSTFYFLSYYQAAEARRLVTLKPASPQARILPITTIDHYADIGPVSK